MDTAQHKTVNLIFFMRFLWIVWFSSMNLVVGKSFYNVKMMHPRVLPKCLGSRGRGRSLAISGKLELRGRGLRLGHPRVGEG